MEQVSDWAIIIVKRPKLSDLGMQRDYCFWQCDARNKNTKMKLLLVLIQWIFCIPRLEAQISRDTPIVFRWKLKDSTKTWCLSADGLSMSDGKKLVSYIGNCCDYPKLIWKGTGEICNEDQSVCLGKSDVDTDVKFTKKAEDFAQFELNSDRILKRKDTGWCVARDSEDHQYRTCLSYYNKQIEGYICQNVTENFSNNWMLFDVSTNEYCWQPDSFSDGQTLRGKSSPDCCSTYRFSRKADGSMFIRSTDNMQEFCLQIEGMPHHDQSDLVGQKLKLETECKGSAFRWSVHKISWKVVHTNVCVYRESNEEVRLKVCDSSIPEVRQGTCNPTVTSLTTEASSTGVLPSSSFALLPISSSLLFLSSAFPLTALSYLPLSTSSFPSLMPSSSASQMPSQASHGALMISAAVLPLPSQPWPSSSPSLVESSRLSSTSKVSTSQLGSSTSSPLQLSFPSSHIVQQQSQPTSPLTPTVSHKLPSSSTFSASHSQSLPSSSQLIPSSTNSPPALISSTTPDPATKKPPFQVIYPGDPVDGSWGEWTPFSSCTVNCGNGTQERLRYCDNPSPKNGGKNCLGDGKEIRSCIKAACSGEILSSQGENCISVCQSKGLACSPSIQTGNSHESFFRAGVKCSSDDTAKLWAKTFEPAYFTETKKCTGYVSVPAFIVCNITAPSGIRRLCNCITKGDKGYGAWTPWSDCTLTCDGGKKTRTRTCLTSQPSDAECKGDASEVAECNIKKCPIDGRFTEWSTWSTCSRSCDGGTRDRNRSCSNPYPEYGGSLCYGNYYEKESCGVGFCPVDGEWTPWTDWQHCDKPCNSGRRRRQRWCENPTPKYGGRFCQGNDTELVTCNAFQCPNSTITLQNVPFKQNWKDGYADPSTASFVSFYQEINLNVRRLFYGDFLNNYVTVSVHDLRRGSVIASFTLYFTALDSFQSLFLMDAIQIDYYLGKLPIVNTQTANFSSPIVPSSAPANVTAVSKSASTIDVSWGELPVSDQNGVITGYLVFYREVIATSYITTATMQLNTTIRGLAAGTDYALRVLAYNANGNGIASDVIVLRTKEKAPSLPPQSLSVVTMSAFSLFVEWTHPPTHSWNGVIKGYKLHVKSDDGAFTRSLNVDGNSVFTNVNELNPYTLYIVDVCAFTSAGDGPCLRSFNKTFVSPPSKPPGNLSCLNRTNTKSIIVSFDPVAMDFIHGILKGYRIEYLLLKRGLQPKSNERLEFMIVDPFDKQATIQKLEPNSVYEIRVMAFNEHGIGVKSSPIYGETCPCPEVVFTNYASTVPYIYRDSKGDMRGIFETLLRNITSDVCGLCNGKSSKIDFVNDGKNGWADKGTIKRVNEGIDDYVHMSFAIAGRAEMPEFIGKPYVSLIAHPGMVLYVKKTTTEEHLNYMLGSLFQLWPIFIINIVFIVVAGIIFAALTTEDIIKKNPCFFLAGSFRGMYWAYVTMFTHGYGDIAPDKVISRIFTVIWILVGLVTSAILIGAISTALTSSASHMEARLYDIELATLHGSKEEIVGINRNAKVNSKKNYSKIEDVYKALKNREVDAALVDAFVAASRPDLFSDDGIIARKMVKYSYTYGIVLSGDMENTNLNINNYISDNRQYITQMIDNTTPRLPTTFKQPAAISLFDPSSPFLRSTVVILCVTFAVLFTLGWMYDIFTKRRKQKRRKVFPGETEGLKKSQMICEEFFNNVQELCRKMELKDEENLQKLSKMKSFMKNEIEAFIVLHRKRKKREKFDNISRLLISHQVVRISQEQSSEI